MSRSGTEMAAVPALSGSPGISNNSGLSSATRSKFERASDFYLQFEVAATLKPSGRARPAALASLGGGKLP